MTRVVESVVAEFEDVLTWEKVVTSDLAGAMRFSEFSKSLGRPAPVPSIVIDGVLTFKSTPSTEELKVCIGRMIKKLSLTLD